MSSEFACSSSSLFESTFSTPYTNKVMSGLIQRCVCVCVCVSSHYTKTRTRSIGTKSTELVYKLQQNGVLLDTYA